MSLSVLYFDFWSKIASIVFWVYKALSIFYSSFPKSLNFLILFGLIEL